MNYHPSRFRLIACAPVALIAAFAAGVLEADDMAQVTVTAVRPVAKSVGQTPRGASVEEVTLQKRVNYSDLDLGTRAGAHALESRVKDAARSACKELEMRDPVAAPRAKDCYGPAVESAMVQVRALMAAARSKANEP